MVNYSGVSSALKLLFYGDYGDFVGLFQQFPILEGFYSGFSSTTDLISPRNTLWKVNESGYKSEILLRGEKLDW